MRDSSHRVNSLLDFLGVVLGEWGVGGGTKPLSFMFKKFVGGDVFEGSDKAFGSAGTSEIVLFAS